MFSEFRRKDTLNAVWHLGQFDEDWDGSLLVEQEGMESNSALAWIASVQRNAASIVAAAEQARVESPESKASAPSWDLSSVDGSSSTSPDATEMSRPSRVPSSTDAAERPTIPDNDPRAAATPDPDLTDAPKAPTELPTVEGLRSESFQLETVLKAQFSSERFERAMSTLERYGPEEGLRRLKESDPEVAKQVQRHRNEEAVSQ